MNQTVCVAPANLAMRLPLTTARGAHLETATGARNSFRFRCALSTTGGMNSALRFRSSRRCGGSDKMHPTKADFQHQPQRDLTATAQEGYTQHVKSLALVALLIVTGLAHAEPAVKR